MDRESLYQNIKAKGSYLCVGLDTDLEKIPSFLRSEKDPIFEFNRRIIDSTVDYCVAYKPNLAFYEAHGSYGWDSLQRTLEYIPNDIFTIADAKRGDIGNTSKMYAKAFFEDLGFDAITLSPYMGHDSIEPYLLFDDKWVIILALTSNSGSQDFQKLRVDDGEFFYEKIITGVPQASNFDKVMFVVGATQGETIGEVRGLAKENFFLVPGVGAQGGDLEAVSKFGFNSHCGVLVNSSRGIIYASTERDFEVAAGKAARDLADQMEGFLQEYL